VDDNGYGGSALVGNFLQHLFFAESPKLHSFGNLLSVSQAKPRLRLPPWEKLVREDKYFFVHESKSSKSGHIHAYSEVGSGKLLRVGSGLEELQARLWFDAANPDSLTSKADTADSLKVEKYEL
jgi:hypothetical protein